VIPARKNLEIPVATAGFVENLSGAKAMVGK
jgi:hypothetical protein